MRVLWQERLVVADHGGGKKRTRLKSWESAMLLLLPQYLVGLPADSHFKIEENSMQFALICLTSLRHTDIRLAAECYLPTRAQGQPFISTSFIYVGPCVLSYSVLVYWANCCNGVSLTAVLDCRFEHS